VARAVVLGGLFVDAGARLLISRPKTRVDRAEWLHQFCARAMKRLKIPVEVVGPVPSGGVVISNHLTYVDIVTLAAVLRCVFCSKAELQKTPVLGWMTTSAGTVYVDRGRGGSAMRAAGGMQAASAAGLPVVFFPEGTTSTMNGTGLLKFHSGLLGMALLSKEPITAAFLRYWLDQDNGPDVTLNEDVCWGDRNLLLHIFKLLGLRGLRVHLRFADGPIRFSADGMHRKAAAEEARVAVGRLGGLVMEAEEEGGAAVVVDGSLQH
jgi:1-acyl-sn-glycerol-3-phosphate acyltransferase